MRDSLLSQFETHHRRQYDLYLKKCPAGQQLVLQMLPLLCHLNHPSLPGYHGEDCPAGLSMYHPEHHLVLQASRQFRGFHYQSKAQHVYRLKGLYLLPKQGLLDSVAQTNPPLEIWVIHQAGLPPEAIDKLQQKMSTLSAWAQTFDCPLSVFIISESDLVQHPKIQSALEDFYCYGLILAGLPPQFWSETEDASEPSASKTTISFGDRPALTAQACFDQAFQAWQSAWSLSADNILKQAFYQQQLRCFPQTLSLADIRRSKLTAQDHINPYALDPVTLMFEQLTQVTLPEALTSLFYQVCHEALSKQVLYPTQPLKRAFIENAVKQWGWSDLQRQQADLPETYHYRQRLLQRPMYDQWQQSSLQALQTFATQHGLPEQAQLNWARKHFSAKCFLPESALPELPSAFKLIDGFDQLYLYRFVDSDYWYLSEVEMATASATALHQHPALIALLSIAILNGLLTHTTSLRIVDHQQVITATQAHRQYTLLRQHLLISAFSGEEGGYPADWLRRLLIFVNYPKDNLLVDNQAKPFISSRKNDPLRYSYAELNLVQQIEVLIQTENGQWHYLTQQGDQATIELLTMLLRWPFDDRLIKNLTVFCATALYGGAITARLQQLITAVLHHKYLFPEAGRFYLQTAQTLWQISWQDDQLETRLFPQNTPIFTMLSHDENDFIAHYLDDRIEEAKWLNPILNYQSPKTIQLFFQTLGTQTEILLMDPVGRLSRHHYAFDTASILPDNLLQFFTTTAPDAPVHCYQLDDTIAAHPIQSLDLMPLITGCTAELNRTRLTLTLHYQDAVFTGTLSDRLFDHHLSEWIIDNLPSADILLLDSLILVSEKNRPSELLTLKSRIETRLNHVLRAARLVYSASRSL